MIKLIVTDMDGTLLNDQHKIHPDFWEIEELLYNKGIMFSVASGRQFYNLESKFDRIKDRMLFFAENGTHVVYKGEDLYIDPLEKAAALNFVKKGRELPNTHIVLCGKNSAYIESKDDGFFNEIHEFYKKVEKVDDLTKVDDTFLKVTFCNFNGVEENTYPHLEEFINNYKVAIAANVFIDITAITANKGNAISDIQKKLNITPDETLVFGDYLNDLEMMQNAKYSYAMKNAHPEIINASKFVTTFSNNENGVLKTIEELGLLQEEYVLKS